MGFESVSPKKSCLCETTSEPTGCSGGRNDNAKGWEIPAGFRAVPGGLEKDPAVAPPTEGGDAA